MNDFYSEHLIKKKREAKDVLIQVFMIILTIFCVLFHRAMPLGIVVCCLLIVADVVIFRMLDIEYEYIYINGELDIDKITHKERRKKVCSVSLEEIEVIGPTGCSEVAVHKSIPTLDVSSKTGNRETFEIIVLNGGVRKKIIFEPKAEMIEDMWTRAPRKVIRKK